MSFCQLGWQGGIWAEQTTIQALANFLGLHVAIINLSDTAPAFVRVSPDNGVPTRWVVLVLLTKKEHYQLVLLEKHAVTEVSRLPEFFRIKFALA